jgi:hypothetical protein
VRKRASRPPEQVFAVTGLATSLQDDQGQRMRRYLVSMGIRTVCFILAVVALAGLHWTLIGWALVVAAVLLPYVAVVMANATTPRRSTTLGPLTIDPATPMLTPPLTPPPSPPMPPDRPEEDPPL